MKVPQITQPKTRQEKRNRKTNNEHMTQIENKYQKT